MRPDKRKDRRMIESRRSPVSRRVAQRAIGREAGGDVSRIRGPSEIRFMAAVASCRQRSVIVIRVATRARHSRMRSRQRERCRVVIEARSGPIRGRVAGTARRGEASRHVRGSVGPRVIRSMA